jgi:cytochrome b pre-mRNA-processing protein 3
MILQVFRRSTYDRNMSSLYGAIVAQARASAFYRHCGVPDTVEGRFELIVLHLVLVLRRLEPGNNDPKDRNRGGRVTQDLFDVFCRDLDDNLREMGVGDLAVPRRMRGFGEAFYGRQSAYRAALAADDPSVLEDALARNILGGKDVDAGAARLARYVYAATAQLEAQADGALIAGTADFPDPEAFIDG